jgi:hypothetical protein
MTTTPSMTAEIEGSGQQVRLPFPYGFVLQVSNKKKAALNGLSPEPEVT